MNSCTYVATILLLVSCASSEKCRECREISASSGYTYNTETKCSDATEVTCPDSRPDCISWRYSADLFISSHERRSVQKIGAMCGIAGRWKCEKEVRDWKRQGYENITCEYGADVWTADVWTAKSTWATKLLSLILKVLFGLFCLTCCKVLNEIGIMLSRRRE